jgi:hypothetical protein
MRTIVAALAVTALCAVAAPAAEKKPKVDPLTSALAGRVAGKPSECVDPHWTDGPQIIDDHTILYRESGRRIWRADVEGPCPALRPQVTLITRIYGSQLCRNDQFQVLEIGSRIPSAFCRFGKFTPYDKPPGAK